MGKAFPSNSSAKTLLPGSCGSPVMQPEDVTALAALQIASQPVYLLTGHMVEHEGSPHSQSQGQGQGQGQLSPSQGSSPQAPCVASVLTATCWTLEVGVAVLLMTLAAAIILALLYWALRLRHKLKVARAGNALEYWGFFRSARYDLKEPYLLPEAFPVPVAMTVVTPGPEVAAPPVADSKPPLDPTPPPPLPPPPPPASPPQDQLPPPYSEPPPPCPPSTSKALLPPPEPPTQLRRPSPIPRRLTGKAQPSPRGSPVLRTTSVPTIPFPSLPRPHHPLPLAPTPLRPVSAQPLPFIHTTPPSPYLSWGACSDGDVYSRVGSMRSGLSRTSSNSQTQVLFFEHSAL